MHIIFSYLFSKSLICLFPPPPLRSKLTDMILVIKYENLFRNSASHCCTLIFFWSSIAKNYPGLGQAGIFYDDSRGLSINQIKKSIFDSKSKHTSHVTCLQSRLLNIMLLTPSVHNEHFIHDKEFQGLRIKHNPHFHTHLPKPNRIMNMLIKPSLNLD